MPWEVHRAGVKGLEPKGGWQSLGSEHLGRPPGCSQPGSCTESWKTQIWPCPPSPAGQPTDSERVLQLLDHTPSLGTPAVRYTSRKKGLRAAEGSLGALLSPLRAWAPASSSPRSRRVHASPHQNLCSSGLPGRLGENAFPVGGGGLAGGNSLMPQVSNLVRCGRESKAGPPGDAVCKTSS